MPGKRAGIEGEGLQDTHPGWPQRGDLDGLEGSTELRCYSVLPSDKRFLMATSLKIDDTLKGRVQQLASQRRRSPHWIMLEAIQQYVEREEALASWAAFKETGRHLTGQEARTWLDTWGTDDEKAVPDCHE